MWGCLFCAGMITQGYAASVKEIDKKIQGHRKELEHLEFQIQDLESEKNKLKKNEDSLSRTIKRIQSKIEESVKRQVRLNRQISETGSRIKKMAEQAAIYAGEKMKWEENILNDLKIYYAQFLTVPKFQNRPMENRAYRALIGLKYSNMKSAESRKLSASKKENQLLNYKKNLTSLKIKSEQEMESQKNLQEEKNRLLQTTHGKRVIAEEEVSRLRETSKMLESLITQLIQKKEKTLAAKREADLLKKSFEGRKGFFDWPVSGTVILQFGKHKHPDLNIMVSYNGIKIKTQPNSPVKSIDRGTVVYASDFRSYGQTVIVDHGGDIYSIYGLLGDIQVKEGEKIPSGKTLGNTGNDAQLYFEFRNQGKAENPLQWLK